MNQTKKFYKNISGFALTTKPDLFGFVVRANVVGYKPGYIAEGREAVLNHYHLVW
ncbi:hypothetical protein [Pontibacter diazotrophicus]|uniref:hypothetical protein n=1 Tax=Pontibacter diazotrophicus TaxID=1400979 RepID=UPI0015F1442D|nr:hypothetical protein [Pontibacter diazotrophicus]